jgi:hypothetical protein
MRNGRVHLRHLALLTCLVALGALLIPLSGVAQANHGDRKLDATPENPTRGVGATHTITARLCENDPEAPSPANCNIDFPPTNGSGAIRIRFENENGPNDTDDSISRMTPDRSCSVFPNSDPPSQCSISYVGTAAGTDTWRVWVDHDDSAATDESDVDEARNEQQMPGDPADLCGSLPGPAEPDCTDVVNVTWAGGAPAQLDCDDSGAPDTERENNPSGGGSGNETYNCEVRDAQGNLTGDADPNTDGNQQIRVHGEVRNSVNDPDNPDSESYTSEDYSCNVGRPNTTNETLGKCPPITVTQNEGETGTAVICFWVGTQDQPTGMSLCGSGQEPTEENQQANGSDTGNDLADQVDITWQESNSGEGGLDAEPETDSGTTGTDKTITSTLYDQFGVPAQETTTINFEFFEGSASDTDGNTPASPDKTCQTNNSSNCTVTYTSNDAGRDLVCSWVHTAPSMTGDEQGGTCDGEGLLDADDTAGSADPPEPTTDDVDVVSKTWTNETAATQLDCVQESDKTRRSRNNVVVCTATNGSNGIEDTNIDVELTGANDPDGSSSASPDLTCTTNGSGVCQVTHQGAGSNDLGKTTYRAWIDADYFDQTTEADGTEQRDESTPQGAGGTAEPDATDVVETQWIPNRNRSIALSSSHNSRKTGRKVVFSVNINGDDACEADQSVKLKARSNNKKFQTIGSGTTDDDGEIKFTITVNNTRDYRADAPKSTAFGGTCKRALSNVVKVTAT